MSQIFVVTSGKGGVGKTTTTCNLAVAVCKNKPSAQVIVVDGDIGLRNLDVVMGLENRIVHDIIDLINENCEIEQALITHKKVANLSLIAASQHHEKEDISLEQMKNLCSKLKKHADYVFIDCPAGIEQGFKNCVGAADEAIVICNPEMSAIRDADRVIGLLNSEQISSKLIVNRLIPELVKDEKTLSYQDIQDGLAIPLLGVIPEDQNVLLASNEGKSLFDFKDSQAALAYQRIARRLSGEEVVVPRFRSDTTLFRNLKKWFKG